METIKAKIQELVLMNKIEPVYKYGSNDSNTLENIMKRQEKLIQELRVLACAQKTLLGHVVRFPQADSYSLYVVTKVNKATVQLTWIRYCDAWIDDRLEYQGSISRDYVEKYTLRYAI
jgi:hypothetical protein